MGARAQLRIENVEDLTPEALEERGQRLIAEGQRLVIRAQVRRELAAHELVDQDSAPFDRKLFVRLCRSGKLPATKVHRRWLVRRDDLYAYIQKHGLARGLSEKDEDVDDIIDRVMNDDGERKRRR